MTDRFNALTVVLDHDIRDEDAEPLIAAIKMLKGVLSVHPHVSGSTDLVAEDRAKYELRAKLFEALK
jgi:hypothetical protein